MMRSNTDLTPREFEVSFQLKLALQMLVSDNPLAAKKNVLAALKALHAD